jgi:hypothetical protein
VFALVYGVVVINYVDLTSTGGPFYHLWLLCAAFAPFLPLLFVIGLRSWKLVLAMGLLVTLLNDLTYAPMGNFLFNQGRDLLSWYSNQLGLAGWAYRFYADFGFFRVPAWSWLMGLTVYLRAAAIGVLLWSWRRSDVTQQNTQGRRTSGKTYELHSW